MTVFLSCLLAVILARWLGEPKRWQPADQFGRWVYGVDELIYTTSESSTRQRRRRALVAVVLCVLPFVLLAVVLSALGPFGLMFDVLVLYLALSSADIESQVEAVIDRLRRFEINEARQSMTSLVDFQVSGLEEPGILRGLLEWMFSRANSGWFAPLFWFVSAGAPAVVLYRLVELLSGIWNENSEHDREQAWAATKVRQLLEWLPARCLALTYALSGDRSRALRCWREYALVWRDTNNGVLIATGSGALGVSVGGGIPNDKTTSYRPILGDGPAPKIKDVERAMRIINRGVWWWLAVIFLVELI